MFVLPGGNLYSKAANQLQALHHCQPLHLAMISSGDFLKLVGTAKHLEKVNIESCSRISEEAIFKAKRSLPV